MNISADAGSLQHALDSIWSLLEMESAVLDGIDIAIVPAFFLRTHDAFPYSKVS